MVIDTMITPPHGWKPMISPKPINESNHYRLTRTSVLPTLACMDFCRKVQDSFPDDKIRRQSDETRDWKYKFKTGDLIRIPLSNIMTGPVENEARRIADKNLNYCKWTESGTISYDDESFALTKSAKMSRHVSSNRYHNNAKKHRSSVLAMPLPKSSVITISSQLNPDQYCSILQENIRNLRRDNTENHFRNGSVKQCSEIPKTKFQEVKKRTPFKVSFSSQAINTNLEKNFKYKVNASELPRSQTPLSEKDPDKMSFKNVASFLSDDLESSSSVDNRSRLDLSAIETVNATPCSETPSEHLFDLCCRNQNGSSLKLPENTDALNLVSADIFSSPPRSVHSSGAFKTSFRLRRAPKHGTKTKKEMDSLDAHPQNESKHRLKLQKFLDFAVSTRERSAHRDGFTSAAPSKEFLQVPPQHNGFGKQVLVAGNDATLENSQESDSRCHTEMRESNTAMTPSEKDYQSISENSRPRQYSFSHSDKKIHCKRNSVQKGNLDLADVLVNDRKCSTPYEKGRKNTESGSTIKSGHSVVIIPACTPVPNDGGNSSDSEIISDFADQSTVDIRSLQPSSSAANVSCKTSAPLNSGSSANMCTLSVFSKQRQESSHRNRNQTRKLAAGYEPERIPASKLKDYSPVKLTFRKERIISLKNAEFLSKFMNYEKSEQTKSSESEYE